ncbi:MAG: DUF1800 domain-containing protein [Bryobacterales bacterium]|nr:DUF1800 domain-containing protein [Bryobacterales bacterium]
MRWRMPVIAGAGRRSFTKALCAILGVPLAVSILIGEESAIRSTPAFSEPLDEARQVEHVANRLTFGPAPDVVASLRAIGIHKWIELQMQPERVPESKLLEEKLAAYPALRMTTEELAKEYPNRQYLRAVARGRADLPTDPKERETVEALAKVQAERERGFLKQARSKGTPAEPARNNATASGDGQSLVGMSEAERLIALAGMTAEERQAAIRSLPIAERRALVESVRPALTVQTSLVAGKLLRAVYSERQLEELMTSFWFNHFNVSVKKEADRYYSIPYERDVIRKHAFGKFEDLLVATAQSPAMLYYLDNYQSVSPDARLRRRRQRGNRAPRGLNENYARELMELHTLGVDGGYTQKDVTEVARCFTGWTIDVRTPGGGFRFAPQLHDTKSKVVLGHKIDAGGMEDGLRVLSLLANHPSTARFISTKLAERFVADQPPAGLVDAMSATFLRTHGDIREVLRTMFFSKEFLSEGAYRAKVKQPFEMVVSALRALHADLTQPVALARALDRLGQPLYRKQEPTGYSAMNAEWVNSAALVERMNLALGLAANQVRGVRWRDIPATGPATVEMARSEWMLPVSESTVASIHKAIDDPAQEQLRQFRGASEPQLWAGLLLGSPEFQRH